MLLGTLGLLRNMLAVKGIIELVKKHLQQIRIFNASLSFE